MKHLLLLSIASLGLAACNSDVDEQWELDHDRIIAVRAEPPGITSGQKSKLDFLAGYETLPAEVKKPDFAQVVSPMSLSGVVSNDAGDWVVTAPSAAQLDAARAELGLAADAPRTAHRRYRRRVAHPGGGPHG